MVAECVGGIGDLDIVDVGTQRFSDVNKFSKSLMALVSIIELEGKDTDLV